MTMFMRTVPITKHEARSFVRCNGCDVEAEATEFAQPKDWVGFAMTNGSPLHACPGCTRRPLSDLLSRAEVANG